MSSTITVIMVQLLTQFLPMIGVNIVSADLTTTIQTLTVVLGGVWIWYQRVQKGDVNVFGQRI